MEEKKSEHGLWREDMKRNVSEVPRDSPTMDQGKQLDKIKTASWENIQERQPQNPYY